VHRAGGVRKEDVAEPIAHGTASVVERRRLTLFGAIHRHSSRKETTLEIP
jgi:hypothetical protein